jgi:hypothetical protein
VGLIDRTFRRQWYLCLGIVLAAVLSAVLSAAYFGASVVWLNFARNLPRLFTLAYPLQSGNVGLSMLIFHLTNQHVSIVILALLVGVFAFIVIVTSADVRRARSAGANEGSSELREAFAVAGMGSATMILASNLAWLHYYVLLIPMSLYLLRPIADVGVPRRFDGVSRILALAALLLLSTSVGSLVRNMVYFSITINVAAVGTVLLLLLDVWHERLMAARVAVAANHAPHSSTKRRQGGGAQPDAGRRKKRY